MNQLFAFVILFMQDVDPAQYADVPTTTAEVAFTGYLTVFSKLIIAAGSILALLAASRIFHNHHIGSQTILKGTSNLILGMLALLIIHGFLLLL